MSAPSTTASTSTATESAIPALTTPYVFPASCSHIYNITSRTTDYEQFAFLSETFLYVDTAQSHIYVPRSVNSWKDSHWKSCQPPGRFMISGHYGTAYSGVVCPSGWIAWSVGMQSMFMSYNGEKVKKNAVSSTWSTAFCCQIGHTLVDDTWSIYGYDFDKKVCMEGFSSAASSGPTITIPTYRSSFPFFEIAATTTPSSRASGSSGSNGLSNPDTLASAATLTFSTYTLISQTTTFTHGRAFYPPWSIEWEASNNPTLIPQWPTLTSDMLIHTLVPGNTHIASGVFDHKGTGPRPVPPPYYEKSWSFPVMLVLGVLLGLAIVGLGILGWWVRRLKRMGMGQMEEVKDSREPAGPGAAKRVEMLNGERARIVDIRRSRRSNPL